MSFRQFLFKNTYLNYVRSLTEDSKRMIWAGTNDGLIVFHPDELLSDKNNGKTDDMHPFNVQRLPGHNEVKVVYEDRKRRMWIGVTSQGLYLLEKNDRQNHLTFKHYGKENGLSNETVQSIIEDNEGSIWISTESGISRLNEKTARFENFVYPNYYNPAIFNELSCWKDESGKLMFGSYNGVYILNPSDIHFNAYAPDVWITGLFINGNPVVPSETESPLQKSITDTKRLVLNHTQNSFNLECTLPDYQAPELNQYAYYLCGYETQWNKGTGNNVATYRNIPPGTYLFKVKGSNSSGVWSKHTTELEIVILPPWWKSGKAIAAYIITGILLIYFAIRIAWKMNRLRMNVAIEKQLTEYKLRFFTNISHEFRTPLTIIKGVVEDLSGRKDLQADLVSQIRLLAKNSNRLMRLIDQLLEFRRLQNNKTKLYTESTEAESFFKEIWQSFEEMAQKKRIDYRFESNANGLFIQLDRSKMDKIAYNLLSNAFKHTPEGGNILFQIEVAEAQDTFTLRVSDSGPGIPADKRKMLFVRFAQIDYATEGTGIGLHLISELAKEHKGNITYSDSTWGGACFTVTVPLAERHYIPTTVKQTAETSHQAQDTESARPHPEAKAFGEYKLMIVDDEEDIRNMLTLQLSRYFTVISAKNGTEGLKQIAEEQPDLVVCDIMMPEMNGIEFTRKLKENFTISHIPVILLTAYSSEELQLEGIRNGADSYITKPFSPQYLLARIINLIETREKLQRRFSTDPTLSKPLITTTDPDKEFLDKINHLIETNLGNADFKLETYAASLQLGRSSFFSKVKSLTGYSPNEYVRILRFKKATELLITTNLKISEIAFQIGMNDPLYFSRSFKNLTGKSPMQYRKEGAPNPS